MTTKENIKAMMEEIDNKCGDIYNTEEYSYIQLGHLTLSYAINEIRKGNAPWQELMAEMNYEALRLAEDSGMEFYPIISTAYFAFKEYAEKYNITAMDLAE